MKILHIARYGSVKGGTESYVRELCQGQIDAGHDVRLASRFDLDDSRAEVRNGAQLAAFTSRGDAPTSIEADEVSRLLDRLKPDLVHIHNFEAAWLPAFVASRAPTISGIHDHRLDCPTGTRYWAGWNRACDIAPGSRCLGYNVAAHCGSLRANLTLEPYLRWRRLLHSAIDGPSIQVFSKFMELQLRRSGVRAPIRVTPYPAPSIHVTGSEESSIPVIFASGRITKEKGFDLLIDAMQCVETPARLVIAGSGHHADALAKRTVPSRHVMEQIGWIDRDDLARWYGAASVVAVPSAWPEPFGIVGLEAMSAGKPVVATDIGGVREWLEHGVTGLAVAPRNAAGFGRAIQSLLSDPLARARMGSAARERINERFTLERHLILIERMYEQARRGWEEAA
ncbi:MAG: glycosyltransferase family 4 protein [Actinomycetota bacterium]